MNKVYLVHGFTANSQAQWFPWLKDEMNKRGVGCIIPDMPDSDQPYLKQWMSKMENNFVDIDQNTILIGHSLGCITILQYLQEKNVDVKAVIMVSGFMDRADLKDDSTCLDTFFNNKPDLSKIKERVESRVVITAIDDDIIASEASKIMAERLDAKIIVLNEGKHFIERDGYFDFPVLLTEIENLL